MATMPGQTQERPTVSPRSARSSGASARDWRDEANCKGQITLFFAPKAERPQARARREAKAKRLCDECTVFAECRAWAREHREYGYWAGESEEDRHLLGFRVSAPIGVRTRLARKAERNQESA